MNNNQEHNKERAAFDLESWKRRYQYNAETAERNSLMDSGWSQSVAEQCERGALRLYYEVIEVLASTETKAEDFFDRPELVAVQEAARYVCEDFANQERGK